MFEKLEILQLASGVARHATTRQSVIARNIANADMPGYKSQDIAAFATTVRENTAGFAPRATRAKHFSAQEGVSWRSRKTEEASSKPNGNSVSLENEMVKAVTTRQSHQMAVSVYKTSMDILRTSLGRR